jgi:hypothetical protein
MINDEENLRELGGLGVGVMVCLCDHGSRHSDRSSIGENDYEP